MSAPHFTTAVEHHINQLARTDPKTSTLAMSGRIAALPETIDLSALPKYRDHLVRTGQFPPPDLQARPWRPLGGSILPPAPAATANAALPVGFVPPPRALLPDIAAPRQRRVDRKMGLIRRSGLFGADTKGARISRAANLRDLREAYELVQRVYQQTGFIVPDDTHRGPVREDTTIENPAIRARLFEHSPHAATFIAKIEGRVVGVLSIVHDSPAFGLPSDSAFANELRQLRAEGKRLVEITNQAVDEQFRSSAVPTELMRCVLAHSLEAGIDAGIAAVSPSHHAFYELLGFRRIGAERSYSGKVHDPVIPVQIDLDLHRHPKRDMDEVERFMHSFLTAENPYFLYVQAWDNAAKEYFSQPHIMPALLRDCSEETLAAMRKEAEMMATRILGPVFVECLPPRVPDVRDLLAPEADHHFLPPHTTVEPMARGVDDAVAIQRFTGELGLPEGEVRLWKEEASADDEAPAANDWWAVPPTQRTGPRPYRIRSFQSVFHAHTARRTPRARS